MLLLLLFSIVGLSALFNVFYKKDTEVKNLIDNTVVSYKKHFCKTRFALFSGVRNNSMKETFIALKNGVDVNSISLISSNTALHYAVIERNTKIVKFLLKRGANINAQNKYGVTPLMLAVQLEENIIVELLLIKKADTSLMNNFQETAYSLACYKFNYDLIDILSPYVSEDDKIIKEIYGFNC